MWPGGLPSAGPARRRCRSSSSSQHLSRAGDQRRGKQLGARTAGPAALVELGELVVADDVQQLARVPSGRSGRRAGVPPGRRGRAAKTAMPEPVGPAAQRL